MDNALEHSLKLAYPALFALSSPTYKICADIGNGWEPLIADMCRDLEAAPNKPLNQRVISIRAKRGIMIFHISFVTQAAWDIGMYYRGLSRTVCQRCGESDRKPVVKRRPKHKDRYRLCPSCFRIVHGIDQDQ